MEARLTEIDPREVQRMLGDFGQELSLQTEQEIATAWKAVKEIAAPKLTYRIFPIKDIYLQEHILLGKDIRAMLANCNKVILFAATLGAPLDAYHRRLQITDMARAVWFDACANCAIEAVCDNFCHDLGMEYPFLTDRFSTGYGDLPLSVQQEFLTLLKMQQTIGVTLTEGGLMIPQKTVTALLGIADKPQNRRRDCLHCKSFATCGGKDTNHCEAR